MSQWHSDGSQRGADFVGDRPTVNMTSSSSRSSICFGGQPGGSRRSSDETTIDEEYVHNDQPQYVMHGSRLLIPLDSPIWYRNAVPHLLHHHIRSDALSEVHLAVALSRKESATCASITKITICAFTAFVPILCMDECLTKSLFLSNLQRRLSALNKEHYSGNPVLSASGRPVFDYSSTCVC
jgi:hypothetical protein